MLRFYCTVCKRVKRVRALPTAFSLPTLDIPYKDTPVESRRGVCNRHIPWRRVKKIGGR